MSIVLVGSTSGSVTLQEPAVAGTTVINLPATSGTMAVTGGSPSFATLTVTGNANFATSSGNVGIGTSSPSTKLQVAGTTKIGVTGTNGELQLARTSDGATITTFQTDGTSGIINSAVSTTFQINTSEKMRITSAGYVKASNNGTYAGSLTGIYHEFNQSGNSDTLGLYSTASSGNQYGLYISTANNQDDTARYFLYCAGGGAQKASFYTNGGLYNYSANNVNLSDRREKTNFAPAKSYLNIICSIPVQTFHYIDQNLEDNNDLTLGVVAQDVQIVAPELVTESNWASKGEPEKMRLSIYQTDLQYALMKCIQEQQAIITDLKARIETLENK